jgi:hypothetical protein
MTTTVQVTAYNHPALVTVHQAGGHKVKHILKDGEKGEYTVTDMQSVDVQEIPERK